MREVRAHDNSGERLPMSLLEVRGNAKTQYPAPELEFDRCCGEGRWCLPMNSAIGASEIERAAALVRLSPL